MTTKITCIYGCSMGGAVVTRFLADRKVKVRSAVMKDRKGDIAYIKKNLPQTVFKVFVDIGHGGLAALKPNLLAAELTRVMGRKT